MEIRFACPHCNRRLRVDSSKAGRSARCPHCKEPLTVPSPSADPGPQPQPEPVPEASVIYCAKCGEQNALNNFKCARCGYALHGPAQPPPAVVDNSMGGLIPYKNTSALVAYYFGIFSLIPCLGLPLGIAALILGIVGLKHAKTHPEAKGKVHAWVGVILGSLSTLVTLAFLLVPAIMGAID